MGISRKRAHDKIVEIFKNCGIPGKILDAPAGTGEISKKILDADFDVYPADVAPEVFQYPDLMKSEKVDLNYGLPYEDEFFDYILSSDGIEHLEDQYNFIGECYRILKPNGKILISTPNVLNLKPRISNVLTGFHLFHTRPQNEVDDYAGGEHINMVNYFDLRINLHRNEFRIILVTTHLYSKTAMFLSFLVPFVYLMTFNSFRRERNNEQRARNREIFRHILSSDLLYGKKLFLLAEKDEHYLKGNTQRSTG